MGRRALKHVTGPVRAAAGQSHWPGQVTQAQQHVVRLHGGGQLVQQQAPDIPTAYLTVETRNANNAAAPAWTGGLKRTDYPSIPHMVQAAGGKLWTPNFASLNEAALRQAQQLGLKVIPWTVNEPADMARLIDWGVDGLITDYPDRARAVMRDKGMALPAAIQGAKTIN